MAKGKLTLPRAAKGKLKQGGPVAVLRGMSGPVKFCDECAASELSISRSEDLFRGVP